VAGSGVLAKSQCDVPVAQRDYLTTLHDLSGSTNDLPSDLDGVSLRPVLEKANDGVLAKRDAGFVFHFPAFYTVPITAFRQGDFKIMRHLNTGEVKLFNVVTDMGESENLAKTMPEKTAEMVATLDEYLKRIGAWTMEEVYEARAEELVNWRDRAKTELAKLKESNLSHNSKRSRLISRKKLTSLKSKKNTRSQSAGCN
jgi:arylsulfatase A-like enzyme